MNVVFIFIYTHFDYLYSDWICFVYAFDINSIANRFLFSTYESDDELDDSSVVDEDEVFFEATKAIFFVNIFFLFFSRFLSFVSSILRASSKISSHSSSIPINPKINSFFLCFLSPGRGSRSNDLVSSRYLDWNSITPELVRTLFIDRRQEKIVEIFCSVLKLLNTTSSM